VPDLRYELLAEVDVTDERRALVDALLGECFDLAEYPGARGRGWLRHSPSYRVLVWDGDVLVGQEMGCFVGCDPPIVLHGFGDLAVREGWRGRGVATRLGALLREEAIRQRVDAVLCFTSRLVGTMREHGMEPVRSGEVYLRRRFRRDLPFVEDWYVRWYGTKTVPLTIHHRF
jgi:GNAT superfamily N-acetyltransferase